MLALRALLTLQLLALAAWVGSTLMMGLGAPHIFWTMREYQPMITAAQHDHVLLRPTDPDRLAGVIAIKLFEQHATIRYTAAGTALATLILIPWAGGRLSRSQLAVLLIALGVLLYEQNNLLPQMNDLRADIYNPALSEIERGAAKDAFQPLHKTAERLVGTEALLALLALAAVPWTHIKPRPKPTTATSQTTPPDIQA
ncbi:hypothetical protein [Mucisphaera sp.]|uniref:hypothetical protein n=1 Tax=Mucisphaera sp. TaxID=2913024 RepID=UPI003D0C3334